MEQLSGKHVLVVGMDARSKRLAHWLPSQGVKVTLADPRDAGELADDLMEFLLDTDVSFALGNQGLDLLDTVDMLCLSDSTPVDAPILRAAEHQKIPIKNDYIFFLEHCAAKRIVGIAGSLGKTTTAALLMEMARKSGFKVWGGEEIPLAHLDEIQEDDIVVLELSSVQLENATISPPVGVLLNVLPTNTARYGGVDGLTSALTQLFYSQKPDDLFVYNRDDMLARAASEHAKSEQASFSSNVLVPDGACLAGSRLIITGICSPTNMAKVICTADEVVIPGEHNMQNVVAACSIAGALGVSPAAMSDTLRTFKSLPHRLNIVSESEGVVWIDDSVATTPDRVMTSLMAISQPVVLMLGGRDHKYNWNDLARLAVEKARLVITFGEHGNAITEHLVRARRFAVRAELETIKGAENLEIAVQIASEQVLSGDIVLFSPGGLATDAYDDMESRGDHFSELVQTLSSNNAPRQ